MEKDFQRWNKTKMMIDKTYRRLLFKEGEIWWCSFGVNVGEEVCGKGDSFRRPAVILKKLSQNSCIVMPTTTKQRDGSWYHFIHLAGLDRWVMMHQIRFISANRLHVRESSLSKDEFLQLKKSAALLLGLFFDGHSPEAGRAQWVTPNV